MLLVVPASGRRLCRIKPEAVEYTLSGAYDYVTPSLRPLNISVHTNQPEAEYEMQALATQPEAVYVFFNRSWPLLHDKFVQPANVMFSKESLSLK